MPSRRTCMQPRMNAIAMTLFALSVQAPTQAQGTASPASPMPAPPACDAPERRQFDFWLGEWDVRDPAGKLVGRNHITSLHQGCVLLENYRAGAFSGSSLNVYDADRRKWHQTWVDSGGSLLVIEGGLDDGRMILAGETLDAAKAGSLVANRITWTPLPDGRVRQLWESSTDNGATWTTAFDGFYAKRK
jgi:hypothetical protein